MRKIQLWVMSLGMFMFFPFQSFSTDQVVSDETVIVKIKDLSSDLNVEIYQYFLQRNDVKVINSCQELGLVVFKSVSSQNSGSQAIAHVVGAILKDQFSIEDVKVMQDYSMNDVNIDCRAKKNALIGQ
ncbi:MAG: hypothetical protein HKN39_05735 [Flavobacteriales bacterium]|nr:hypothetical protein [Flavobacteriales bacterium]